MYHASAAYYDLIYATFKDYAQEAAQMLALLRGLNPHIKTLLDVACGTGEHALRLSQEGYEVDGLDLDPAFVAIAQAKLPARRFFEADMSQFDLPHRYDAVMCLFSSIGYLQTLEKVTEALHCFKRHLAPGGVVVVEPWFPPGVLNPSRVTRTEAHAEGVHIVRTSHLTIDGRVSHLHFDYELTDAEGTQRFSETHSLGLFTPEEQQAAFEAVGLSVEYDPRGLSGRGLFVGRVTS